MKRASIFAAFSLLVTVAQPGFAQTATPATPATPTTPAAPAGVPAAFVNDPVVQQVNTQLAAQGYTITNVSRGANGVYTISAVSANGTPRSITVNPATGAVTDTVNGGAAAGAAADPEGAEHGGRDDDDHGRRDDDNGGNDDNGRDDDNRPGGEDD